MHKERVRRPGTNVAAEVGRHQLDRTRGKGGACVDTAQGLHVGRGWATLLLDPSPRGSAGRRLAVAMSTPSPVLAVEGGQRRAGAGAVLWGWWEAGRMREGRGHPQPPWLSGPGRRSAGSSCCRRVGRVQLRSRATLGRLRVSAASPLGAARGHILFQSQGRDSVPEQGRQTPMAGSQRCPSLCPLPAESTPLFSASQRLSA